MAASHNEMPLNVLPPMVVALVLALGAVEAILQAAGAGYLGGATGIGWRQGAVEDFGFNATVLQQMLDRGGMEIDVIWRFVTYAFVHANAMHAIFSIVFLLALGKVVGEHFGNLAVAIVFLLATVLGALVFYLATSSPIWLIGAMPGAYGMIGAYSFTLWLGLGQQGQNQLRAFRLVGLMMGVQLLFGLFFGGGQDWVANLAGFFSGFALSFVLVPGGWGRVMARLRQR